jgi:hypothetical protein
MLKGFRRIQGSGFHERLEVPQSITNSITSSLSKARRKCSKLFFIPCSKCKNEFAVRFVQVTVYQAEVAAFR